MSRASVFVLLALLLAFGAAAVVTASGDDRPNGAILMSAGGPANASKKVATISNGERVDLAAHALPRGLTVFDFTADW